MFLCAAADADTPDAGPSISNPVLSGNLRGQRQWKMDYGDDYSTK